MDDPNQPQPQPQPNTNSSPLSNYPPMGTMSIGTPTDGVPPTVKPLAEAPNPAPAPAPTTPMPTPMPTPTSSPLPPTPVPTTFGDNHIPEKKHNKTGLIVAIAVIGVLLLGGIIAAVIISNGNGTIVCTSDFTEQNINFHTEHTVNFVMYHADKGSTYQKITFPYHITERYANEYREGLQKQGTSDMFDNLTVRLEGNSIITEGDIRITKLSKNQIGKSKDEVIDIFKEEGFVCRDK